MTAPHGDFEDFLKSPPVEVPPLHTLPVGRELSALVSPSPWLVFSKLCWIVAFVGALNLLLCPQFGIGLSKGIGLLEYFMSFGHLPCKVLCGFFFLATGVGAAAVILSPFDLFVVRRHQWLYFSGVSSLTLVFFLAAGGEVYFSVALAWFVGALTGGLISLSLGKRVRTYLAPLSESFRIYFEQLKSRH